MDSGIARQSNFNLDSSSVTSDQSVKYQSNELPDHLYWSNYYHRMAMWNFPGLYGPFKVTDSHLNPNYLLFQHGNFMPKTNPSSQSYANYFYSSNMRDISRSDPSTSFESEKNLQTELKFGSNWDEWNSKDNVNENTADDTPSNQSEISEDPSDDCPQYSAVYDQDSGKRQMAYRNEMTVGKEKRSSHEIDPIDRSQFMNEHQTNDNVIDKNHIEDIIAREICTAISQAKKRPKLSHSHQEKEKNRSKSGKRPSSKSKTLSDGMDCIKESAFTSSQNPYDINNQQSGQEQSIFQHWINNTPGQHQYQSFVLKMIPEIMHQTAVPQLTCNNCHNICTCKSSVASTYSDYSSSSPSTSKHSGSPSEDRTRMDHSILSILHR